MRAGATPNDGVPDMTVISEIDEYGINTNIKVRYLTDRIYVSQHCSLSAVSLQFFCSLSAVYLQ